MTVATTMLTAREQQRMKNQTVKSRFDRLDELLRRRISEHTRRISVRRVTPNAKLPYFAVTRKSVVQISKARWEKKLG
jgi:hypothetical protein